MPPYAKRVRKAIRKLKPTDWLAATSAGLNAQDFRRHIEDRLDSFMFRANAPIRTIIGTPQDLYVASSMSNSALLVALMGNVYAYGRQHWTWTRSSSSLANAPYEDGVKVHIASLEQNAQRRWTSGRGLLDGTTTEVACAAFNFSLKFLAQEIFDVPGVKAGTAGGDTSINGSFITLPGRQPIDSDWNGNVWYLPTTGAVSAAKKSNEQIRALRFTGHFFVNHLGTIYDVTGNKTYGNADEMIWCRLNENQAKRAAFADARNVFDVQVVNAGPVKAAKYCVDLGEEPSNNKRFSNFLLTDREGLSAGELAEMATWSSV